MVRYEKKGDRRGQIELRVEGNPVLLFASDYSFPKEQRLNLIL